MRFAPAAIRPTSPIVSFTGSARGSTKGARLPAGSGARRVVTDERVRGGRLALAIAGSAMVCVLCTVAAAAQAARFDLLASDTVGGINGLTAYTVRDNQTASCYFVYVLDAEKG